MLIRIATAVLVSVACTATPAPSPSSAPAGPTVVPAVTSTATAAPTPTQAAPSPAVEKAPGADRYGLVLGRTVRSEGDPRKVAELAGDAACGAVSPEGSRLAYWDVLCGGGEARVLRLFDLGATVPDRILLTLPETETAAVSTGGGVVWSSDGASVLIGVTSREYDRNIPVGAARALYAALREVNVGTGAVRELARVERSMPLRPVALESSSRTVAAVGIGGGGYTGSYVVAREGSAPTTTPMCCNIAPAIGAPDASRVLAVSLEPRALFIWPLSDPGRRTTIDAAAGERIDRALWRNAREVVVLVGGDASPAPRLEVWSIDGSRRVVLRGVRDLAGVRADGSAAIADGRIVDLESGRTWAIPGATPLGHVPTLVLR